MRYASEPAELAEPAAEQVTDVVASLDGERYLARVERVPLEPCGPECTDDTSTYVLKELAPLGDRAGVSPGPGIRSSRPG
jgi:hypothetical protein